MPSYNRRVDAVATTTATIPGVRLVALLGLVLLAASPGLAPAQEPEATAKVTVSAKQPWIDTGVDLKADEALTITATGKWTNGGNPPYYADADGFKGFLYDKATLKTADFIALIGKVGDRVFLVGGAYKGTSPGAGRLYLQINDEPVDFAFTDNDGEMVADIRRPAPVGRPAAKVVQDSLKDGGQGPKLVVVPAGTSQMGFPEASGTDLLESSSTSWPAHSVTIAKPFALGACEVTFEDYDRFAEATGRAKPDDAGWGRARQPVINVSWDDARAYTEWLSAQAGARYRLPSEAEWEYAARAGTKTAFWWGDDIGQNRGNFRESGSQWSENRSAPVGSFAANPFGLYDTAGNVWEWVEDRWHPSYEGAPADGSAWTTGDSDSRVCRGGGWRRDDSRLAWSGARGRQTSTARNATVGFRVARDL